MPSAKTASAATTIGTIKALVFWRMTLSDLPSPAEAGFAKAGNRFPLFGIMRRSLRLRLARRAPALRRRVIGARGVYPNLFNRGCGACLLDLFPERRVRF